MIYFSGYNWEIKHSPEKLCPGPNFFSKRCVSVNNEELKIEFIKEGGDVLCGEVICSKPLGYGKYIFFISSRVDLLPDNGVLGLFTWSYDAHPTKREIDIEFSKWDGETVTNSQYVVQPDKNPGNLHRFNTELNGLYSTHIIDWQAHEVNFLSIHGHHTSPPSKQHIIQSWKYTGKDIPSPENEKLHINLWKYKDSPLALKENQISYVIIKEFVFLPNQHTKNFYSMENRANDYNKLIRIFGYETGGQRNSTLWQNPESLNRNSTKMLSLFSDWEAHKRAILMDDVIQGVWIKVSDHGHNFKVKFNADGTLTECELFNENASWKGTWELIGVALRMKVKNYELDIFANKEGIIHSGIEIDTSTQQPNAYFKLIHISGL